MPGELILSNSLPSIWQKDLLVMLISRPPSCIACLQQSIDEAVEDESAADEPEEQYTDGPSSQVKRQMGNVLQELRAFIHGDDGQVWPLFALRVMIIARTVSEAAYLKA